MQRLDRPFIVTTIWQTVHSNYYMTRRQEAKDGGEPYRTIAVQVCGLDFDELRAVADQMQKKEMRKWNS